jgi:hypothetical protein
MCLHCSVGPRMDSTSTMVGMAQLDAVPTRGWPSRCGVGTDSGESDVGARFASTPRLDEGVLREEVAGIVAATAMRCHPSVVQAAATSTVFTSWSPRPSRRHSTFANVWTAVHLIDGLINATEREDAAQLLACGAAIWATNVIVSALWYREFDRGGPLARAKGTRPHPDFQFAHLQTPDLSHQKMGTGLLRLPVAVIHQRHRVQPTDTLPLSHWAKMAMLTQSCVSLASVALSWPEPSTSSASSSAATVKRRAAVAGARASTEIECQNRPLSASACW